MSTPPIPARRERPAPPQLAEALVTPAEGDATGTFPADSWFKACFGARESQLLCERDRCFADGRFSNGWLAGRFTWPSVAELKDLVDELPAVEGKPRAEFVVEDSVDIGKLQAQLRSEDRAMVQIASNFNCLENCSRDHWPDCGSLVEGYATDATQGPAASFGVPGASLLRAHYAFYDPNTEPATWGQTNDRSVELLGDVGQYFGKCVNGKSTFDGEQDRLQPDEVARVAHAIRVGLHEDAQVIFSKWKGTLSLLSEPFPLVDQVLSASVNWYSSGVMPPAEHLECCTRAALRAAYDGAYLAAILRQRHLLLLTLVGGGAFANPWSMILEEIAAAHDRWAGHPASALQKVQLCLFESGSKKHVWKKLNAQWCGQESEKGKKKKKEKREMEGTEPDGARATEKGEKKRKKKKKNKSEKEKETEHTESDGPNGSENGKKEKKGKDKEKERTGSQGHGASETGQKKNKEKEKEKEKAAKKVQAAEDAEDASEDSVTGAAR